MGELNDDLRATADDIAADAARIQTIEEQKATLTADDPRLVALSAESEELARGLVPKTKGESALVEEAASD